MYRAAIRLIATHTSEIMWLKRNDEEKMRRFKREIKRIVGWQRTSDWGGWHKRLKNQEVEEITDGEYCSEIYKSAENKVFWTCEAQCSGDMIRRVTTGWRPERTRPSGFDDDGDEKYESD